MRNKRWPRATLKRKKRNVWPKAKKKKKNNKAEGLSKKKEEEVLMYAKGIRVKRKMREAQSA